jgi:Leucine-rich repeat (LRR) protein
MDGNQISAITDETFRSLRLQSLTLRSNRIVRIDRHAFYNATVVRLDLSGNQFEQLERATFSQMKRHLTDFDLSRNPRLKLSNLLIILAELINLERLNVCCNGWEDIPLDLFELQGPSLLHLNLSGNKLNSLIPHQLSHLDKLQSLDLSYNSFKGLDEDVLQIVDRIGLGDLILEGNPFACDLCHVSGLIKWVRTRGYSRHSTCSIRTGRGETFKNSFHS